MTTPGVTPPLLARALTDLERQLVAERARRESAERERDAIRGLAAELFVALQRVHDARHRWHDMRIAEATSDKRYPDAEWAYASEVEVRASAALGSAERALRDALAPERAL